MIYRFYENSLTGKLTQSMLKRIFTMNKWEISILKIIESNAGIAPLKHVYSELPHYINLTNNHRNITYNAPKYHHQTRAHVDDLMDSGDIIRISRSIYSITSQGQLRLRNCSIYSY